MKKHINNSTRRHALKTAGVTLCSAFLGGTVMNVFGQETLPPSVMPGESRASQVVWYMRNGVSGGRAVLAVYGDIFGITREMALKITGGFSGGFGHSGEVCGMITAAVMLLGMKHESANILDKESHKKTLDLTQQFIKDFQAQYKSVRCRDLLQVDLNTLNTPERYAQAHKDGVFDVCFRGANTIADLLENKYDIFDRQKKEKK